MVALYSSRGMTCMTGRLSALSDSIICCVQLYDNIAAMHGRSKRSYSCDDS